MLKKNGNKERNETMLLTVQLYYRLLPYVRPDKSVWLGDLPYYLLQEFLAEKLKQTKL